MSREFLNQIDPIRKTRLLSISKNSRDHLQIDNSPPTKSAGLYWIYTSYNDDELKASTSSDDKGAIDICSMMSLHEGLPKICSINQQSKDKKKFRLVYNGIAGKSLGIRGRIHQHFNGGKGTGCLSICKSSLNNLDNWRVSYLVLEHDDRNLIDIDASYELHAKNLERIWRLENGWPLLCKT
ncbi:hypothetical protein [Aliamphritea ceti]|uniref:hypothetical protein n=1 Tax=Aliamphritea ceti TaxID=1524258 RepID=UPI0021C35D35|nr:hypothetical protein [Aliamphritea ceti]